MSLTNANGKNYCCPLNELIVRLTKICSFSRLTRLIINGLINLEKVLAVMLLKASFMYCNKSIKMEFTAQQ